MLSRTPLNSPMGCLANDDIALNFFPSHYCTLTIYIGYIDGLSNLEEPLALDKLKGYFCIALFSSKDLRNAIYKPC